MNLRVSVVLVFILFTSCHTQRISRNAVYNDGWEMIDAAKAVVSQISIKKFKAILDEEREDVLIIDVRTVEEFNSGAVEGAVSIPRDLLEIKIGSENFWKRQNRRVPAKNERIILYCSSGNRSALAAKTLMQLGFTKVKSLDTDWEEME